MLEDASDHLWAESFIVMNRYSTPVSPNGIYFVTAVIMRAGCHAPNEGSGCDEKTKGDRTLAVEIVLLFKSS